MQDSTMTQHRARLSQSQPVGGSTLASVGKATTELMSCPTPLGAGTQETLGSHPCLTSNNSITLTDKGIQGFSENEKEKEYNHYKEKIEPRLGGNQFKQMRRMEHIITNACMKFGHESVGTLDLTFEDDANGNQPSFDYVNKCMNSLRTNVLSKRYGHEENGKHYNDFFVVCEKGGRFGRLHFHVLFAKQGADFRTGSFITKHKGRKQFHPNAECKAEWKYFRGLMERYGFGAHVRIQPLWDVSKGAKYFTKYVGKGHYGRTDEMRGRQLVRYGNGFARWHSMKFSNFGGAARDRRKVLEYLGARYNCLELSELNEQFGSRWQYYAGDQMRFACAMIRKRFLPESTIEWLANYLWVSFKFRLLTQKRGKFQYEVLGAYKYMLKESYVLGRYRQGKCVASLFHADDCYERTELLVRNSLASFALRTLCGKIESDWGNEHHLENKNFSPLPSVGALHNMKQDTNNETKSTSKQREQQHRQTSIKLDGRITEHRHFH